PIIVDEIDARPSVLIRDLLHPDSNVETHLSHDLLLGEPARSRAEHPTDLVKAKAFGHLVEQQGRVRTEEKFPSGADACYGLSYLVEEGRMEVSWRIVKPDSGLAAEHLDPCPLLMQQGGQIDRGSARTDHCHVTPLELVQGTMCGTVGD